MSVVADLSKFHIIRARLGNKEVFTSGLVRAGEDIRDLASQLAPKDTGDLSRSGEVRVIQAGKVEISFGNGLPDDRARAQEFGTLTTPAQPFLEPAVKNTDILFHVKEQLNII